MTLKGLGLFSEEKSWPSLGPNRRPLRPDAENKFIHFTP